MGRGTGRMRWRILGVGLLLGLLFASLLPGLLGVRFDNYHWLPAEHPVRAAKEYLDKEFEQGESLVVGIRTKQDYFSEGVLDELDAVYRELEQNRYIKQINSPLHAKLAIMDRDGSLSLTDYKSALDRGLLKDMEDYRQHLIDSDYWGQLIARDANSFALIIKSDIAYGETKYKFAKREEVIGLVGDILSKTDYLNDYDLTGETELIYQLDKRSRGNLLRFLPIVILITFILLILFLRSFLMSLIVMLTALLTLLVTVNVTVFNGHAINVVSLSLPILIVVISVADSIHILARWRHLVYMREPNARLLQTLKETWLPCLATSLTTATGFGVFYVSELLPLSQFGLDAFLSVLLAYPLILLVTFSLLFALGERLDVRVRGKRDKPGAGSQQVRLSLVCRCTRGMQSAGLPITLLILVATGLVIAQLRFAYTETNFLDAFFPKQGKTYQAFQFVDDNLGGSGAIDIILRRENDAFREIEVFDKIRTMVADLEKIPNVNYVNSYLLPIRLVHKEFAPGEDTPTTRQQLAQEILFLEFSRSDTKNDVLSPYVDFTYANSRLHLQTPNLSSLQVRRLLDDHIRPVLADKITADKLLTGTSYYFQALSDYVLRTQLESFLICFILVWFLFILFFGGRIGTIALIANMLPIGVSLGSIAMLGLPFDFATVLVASISLGLCIDDTIHYLHYYQLYQKDKVSTRSLVLPQVSDVLSRPIFLTSLLLLVGFGVFIASDLVVMVRFGFFSALAIAGALFSVFVFLPCMLTLDDKYSGLLPGLKFGRPHPKPRTAARTQTKT